MSQSISFNGVVYVIPDVGDESWGQDLSDYFIAIPQGALQKSGGNFTLTADVNFGASFGLLVAYLKSRAANISTAGLVRLAVSDTIGWRNNANDGNLLLAVNGSDLLTFNGQVLATVTGALTPSRALVTDGSGLIAVSSVTSTEVGFLAGVTSLLLGKDQSGTFTNKNFSDSTCLFVNVSDATKRLLVSLGGASTASTLTLGVPITADRTINFPDGAGTIVLEALAQTLTNKTIEAGSNTITGLDGANFANQSAGTYFGGPYSGSAAAASFKAFKSPTVQTFTSGSGTYNLPAGCLYIIVELVGPGGGGGASGSSGQQNGSAGSGATTFGSLSGGEGSGGSLQAGIGGGGGSASGGDINISGQSGQSGNVITNGTIPGAPGGNSFYSGAGNNGQPGTNGEAAVANTGSGGQGAAGFSGGPGSGAGGGAGGWLRKLITSPSSTYSYSVGSGGGGGAAGTSGWAGGAGAGGRITVYEFYQ